jgi:hypothetical protein
MSPGYTSHGRDRNCRCSPAIRFVTSRLWARFAPAIANISPLKYSLLNSALRSISRYCSGVRNEFGWVDTSLLCRLCTRNSHGGSHSRVPRGEHGIGRDGTSARATYNRTNGGLRASPGITGSRDRKLAQVGKPQIPGTGHEYVAHDTTGNLCRDSTCLGGSNRHRRHGIPSAVCASEPCGRHPVWFMGSLVQIIL